MGFFKTGHFSDCDTEIKEKYLQNKRLQSVKAYSGAYNLYGIKFNYKDSTSDCFGELRSDKEKAILQNDEQLVGAKVGLYNNYII